MAPEPEKEARETIDKLLTQAGWLVCDATAANIHASRGVAIREFPLPGYGFADYLLYIDGKAAGVIEAKKGERRKKEPRTSTRGCAGRTTSGAGLRSEVTGSGFRRHKGATHRSIYNLRAVPIEIDSVWSSFPIAIGSASLEIGQIRADNSPNNTRHASPWKRTRRVTFFWGR